MNEKNIIMFPGRPLTAKDEQDLDNEAKSAKPSQNGPNLRTQEAIQKAVGILNGAATGDLSLVVIGIRPTQNGADFFTALFGDAADLRNAQPELAAVIDRLYTRSGL
jgi:hypothetical protein